VNDKWCANNALQSQGNANFAESAGCENVNGGAIGKWNYLNNNLCGGDPDLWTQYLHNNRDQAIAGKHLDADHVINEGCNMNR
jgi:hypothetical protein